MYVQSCCFAYRTSIDGFDVLVAVASWDRKVTIAEGERDSEDSEDDPMVLITKVTNKYAVALYNSLVHTVSEEKEKPQLMAL